MSYAVILMTSGFIVEASFSGTVREKLIKIAGQVTAGREHLDPGPRKPIRPNSLSKRVLILGLSHHTAATVCLGV